MPTHPAKDEPSNSSTDAGDSAPNETTASAPPPLVGVMQGMVHPHTATSDMKGELIVQGIKVAGR